MMRANEEDACGLLDINYRRGFFGMLGNIDFMHWNGRIVHQLGKVSSKKKDKKATLVLETIASQDT